MTQIIFQSLARVALVVCKNGESHSLCHAERQCRNRRFCAFHITEEVAKVPHLSDDSKECDDSPAPTKLLDPLFAIPTADTAPAFAFGSGASKSTNGSPETAPPVFAFGSSAGATNGCGFNFPFASSATPVPAPVNGATASSGAGTIDAGMLDSDADDDVSL